MKDVRGEIGQAHTEAVDEVVRYLENRAVRGRVSDKGRQVEVETDGVIAAAFDHRTSRAGDPLLHTHVVVANMTPVDSNQGPVWRAIAGPSAPIALHRPSCDRRCGGAQLLVSRVVRTKKLSPLRDP
jgi:conjugative relaxase-like TrwC/TraI family protein